MICQYLSQLRLCPYFRILLWLCRDVYILNGNTMSKYYFCNNINSWLCLYEENKHLKYWSKSRIYVFFSLARGTTHHISWSSQKKRHSWVMLCVWNKIVVRHYVTMYVRSGYNFQKVITFLFLLSDFIRSSILSASPIPLLTVRVVVYWSGFSSHFG